MAAFPILKLFTLVARLACLTFVVIAGFTIPQAWNLNESEYTKDGSTVYIPLEICEPVTISVDGNAIIFQGKDIGKCHTLNYLINACVASMIFAMAATLVFVLFDTLVRCNKGPVKHSSVLGMSLFLTFILVQAAACCYALYNECEFWQDYFMARFKDINSDSVDEVKTYGDTFYFRLTCMVALGTAALVLLDTLLGFCCGGETNNNNANKRKSETKSIVQPEAPSTAASTSDLNKSTDEEQESVAANSSPEAEPEPKNWTDY